MKNPFPLLVLFCAIAFPSSGQEVVHFNSANSGLTGNRVNEINVIGGQVWLAGDAAAYFDGSDWVEIRTDGNYTDVTGADSGVWFSSSDLGMLHYHQGNPVNWNHLNSGLSSFSFSATCAGPEGKMLAYGRQAHYTVNAALNVYKAETWSYNVHPSGYLFDIGHNDSSYLLGSGKGLYFLRTGFQDLHFSTLNSPLPSDSVFCVSRGDSSPVWAGGEDFIAYYDGGWIIYQPGIKDNWGRILDIEVFGKHIYAASEKQGLMHLKGKEWQKVEAGGLPSSATAVAIADPADIWIGTSHEGVYRFHPVTAEEEVPEEPVRFYQAGNRLFIEHGDGGADPVVLRLFDITGRLVNSYSLVKTIGPSVIDLYKITPGIYLVQVAYSGQVFSGKILITRP